jgi:hypothetical protein
MLESLAMRLEVFGLTYRYPLLGGLLLLCGVLALVDGRRRAMQLRWAAATLGVTALMEMGVRLGIPRSGALLALAALGMPVAYLLRLYGTQPWNQAPMPIRQPRRPAPPGPPAAPGTILPIRSIAEEHLYMDFHPCVCGEADWSNLKQGLNLLGPTMASVFAGPCRRCGTPREFLFQVLEPSAQPRAGSFGGPEPSAILDPGQFLTASDLWAKAVPGSAAGLDKTARRKAGASLGMAIAALEEVLKFIPPGAQEIPPQSFRSAESERMRSEMPGQFRRIRLEARLQAYRQALQQFDVAN